jgi:hypothetical protein
VAPTSLFLQLTSTGSSSLTTITSPVAVSPGTLTINVPLTVLGNPGLADSGAPNVDTVTVFGSVAGVGGSQISFAGTQPTLVISGTQSSRFGFFGGVNTTFQQVDTQKVQDFAKTIDESQKQAEAAPAQNSNPGNEKP